MRVSHRGLLDLGPTSKALSLPTLFSCALKPVANSLDMVSCGAQRGP